MYRVTHADGQFLCHSYEHGDHGVELFVDDEMLAFVPYESLHVVMDEDVDQPDDDEEPTVV